MAAVSTHTNGREYRSQRAQDNEPDRWDFSTPTGAENDPAHSYDQSDQDPQQRLNFNPPPQLINGIAQPPRQTRTPDSNTHPKQAAVLDPSYLSPYKGSRPGLDRSHSGSEADSLLDLYGQRRSIDERSRDGSMHSHDTPVQQEEPYLNEDDPENSRWIHRDKLAVIESQEMQEAGIKLPPPQPRPASRSKGRHQRNQSHERPDIPNNEFETPIVKAPKKQRTRSPERDVEAEDTLVHEFDLRTPEEIAADNYMGSSPTYLYTQSTLRKSSSRIPLPKSSNVPIPQEHLERDTPLPRKRGLSNNWTGEDSGLAYPKIRSRTNSIGSQNLLDDTDPFQNTPTPASRPASNGSPPKPSTSRPTHTRRPSNTTRTPDTPPKPRSTSTTTTSPRPKSRSGLDARPPTAVNRPSGDPPWLATMYKPDPRLPPEQQLLPTHAKRLQQQQIELAQKEADARAREQRRIDGKASPQLPREFSPLAEHTINGLQPSSRDADEKGLQEQQQGRNNYNHNLNQKPLPSRNPSSPNPRANSSLTPTSPPNPHSAEWPLGSAAAASAGSKDRDRDPRSLGGEGGPHAGYTAIPRVVGKEGSPSLKSPGGGGRVVDPFERERVERERGRVKGEKDGEGEVEGGRREEKGCGCCVVM